MSSRRSGITKPTASGRITNFFKPLPSRPPNAGPRDDSIAQAGSQEENITGSQNSASFEDPSTSPATRQLLRENSFSGVSTQSSSMTRNQSAKKQRVVPSSDGEESEDSDGLEDLGSMFRGRKPPVQTPRKKEPEDIPIRSKVTATPNAPPEASKPRAYKFSLDKIVEGQARKSSLGDDILRARKMFEEAQKEIPEEENRARPSEEEIGSKLGEGQASRLLGALDRKDAWRIEKSWHFFDVDRMRKSQDRVAFPTDVLGEGWGKICLRDIRIRRDTFISGSVRDVIKAGVSLPEELLEWMFMEMLLEREQDLSFAYYQALSCISSEELLRILSKHGLVPIFRLLGGREDAVSVEGPIHPGPSSRKDDTPLEYWNTQLMVKYIGNLADRITSNEEIFKAACKLLGRLILDVRVAKCASLRAAIEDSLEKLFHAVPDDQWGNSSLAIGHNFISIINDPDTRYRLLSGLPCVTPRTHLFRRRLALAYLFQDPTYLTKEHTDLVRLQRFARALKTNPIFEISNDADYDELRATVCIMDMAIDDGPTSGEPSTNDAEVDALVENFRNMFSKIRDTNAQNLSRTEAKDVIERLMFRLRFAVRKREKMNLVVDTVFGPEWAAKGGKTQTKLQLREREREKEKQT